MKHKVSELDGTKLDMAVALTEGCTDLVHGGGWRSSEGAPLHLFYPSTHWRHGGPIIERERIMLFSWCRDGEFVYDENGNNPRLIVPARWAALHAKDYDAFGESCVEVTHRQGSVGPTPLIAAMRAYVASKFGEEIDL